MRVIIICSVPFDPSKRPRPQPVRLNDRACSLFGFILQAPAHDPVGLVYVLTPSEVWQSHPKIFFRSRPWLPALSETFASKCCLSAPLANLKSDASLRSQKAGQGQSGAWGRIPRPPSSLGRGYTRRHNALLANKNTTPCSCVACLVLRFCSGDESEFRTAMAQEDWWMRGATTTCEASLPTLHTHTRVSMPDFPYAEDASNVAPSSNGCKILSRSASRRQTRSVVDPGHLRLAAEARRENDEG